VPFNARSRGAIHEIEAEAFSAAFLLPRWLVDWHCERQGWSDEDLHHPANVYQLALRAGTSFTAAVWTLHRYKIFDLATARSLAAVDLKKTKRSILDGYEPEDFKRDVWLVSPSDVGTRVYGGPGDLFVLHLKEHSASGYLWRITSALGEEVVVVSDKRKADEPGAVGGIVTHSITAKALRGHAGQLSLHEARPWQPQPPLHEMTLSYDARGAHRQGWYERQRAQHRSRLEAA
jgi:predicted secreted protein